MSTRLGFEGVHASLGCTASIRLGPRVVSDGNETASDFMIEGLQQLVSDTALAACTDGRQAGQVATSSETATQAKYNVYALYVAGAFQDLHATTKVQQCQRSD